MGSEVAGNSVELTFKIEGLAALVAKLDAMGRLEDGKALRSAARAGVKPIFDQAKATIPKSSEFVKTKKGRLVGPGFASRNIRTITQLKQAEGIARASVGTKADANYAVKFVERGTKKQKAQHWLTDAAEQTLDKQNAAISESLQKSIDKAART